MLVNQSSTTKSPEGSNWDSWDPSGIPVPSWQSEAGASTFKQALTQGVSNTCSWTVKDKHGGPPTSPGAAMNITYSHVLRRESLGQSYSWQSSCNKELPQHHLSGQSDLVMLIQEGTKKSKSNGKPGKKALIFQISYGNKIWWEFIYIYKNLSHGFTQGRTPKHLTIFSHGISLKLLQYSVQ